MKIYLADQSGTFLRHLEYLRDRSVMKYDKTRLIEKTTSIAIRTNKDLRELDTRFLFDYRIFPPKILTYLGEWQIQKRPMRVGDTIVQQAAIPPFKNFSQKIIFGVRVNEIINEPDRLGFSYETLEGHVERGISTFTIERSEGARVIFKIHTFSQPGNFLTRLLGPIFSVPYQTYCTRQALLHVKQQLEE